MKPTNSSRSWGKSALFGLACFALPVAMLAVACLWNGLYPFGGESFLAEDLRFQYVDFYAWMLRVFRGEASLFYNPYTGMGTNAWGIFSYYLSSPLILLLPLFGEQHIVAFVWCSTAAKLGLAGVSMGWYLRRRFCLNRPQALGLALCYAFSTWTQTQMRNPQWLDALVLTPLAAYALYLLLQRKRWLPLAFVTAITIICCWYTAYMLLAFMLLLFVLELLAWSYEEKPEHPLRAVLHRLGLMAASLALGLGLSAISFVPTVLQMLSTNTPATSLLPEANGLESVIMGSVLFGWLVDWTPQLFAGTLPLMLALSCLFIRAVPARVRIGGAAALAFLIYGTQNVALQMAWSGFRSPNGFYCRMTWLALFVAVWMAAWALKGLAESSTKASTLSSVLPLGLGVALVAALLCAAYLLVGFTSWYAMAFMGASACIFAVSAWITTRDSASAHADMPSLQYATSAPDAPDAPQHFATPAAPAHPSALRVACCMALCLLPVAELIWCAHATMEQLYTDYPQSYHDAYVAESRAQLAELPEGGTGAYRVDKTYNRMGAASLNEGMALGYHALSSYCSSQNGAAVAFLAQMGYTQENTFSVRYARPNPLMDSLLGLRYVSSDTQWPGYEDKGFSVASAHTQYSTEAGPARFYENPRALALAYGTSDALLGAHALGSGNSFAEQNALVSALLGREVTPWRPLEAQLVSAENGVFSWTVTVPAGTLCYLRTAPLDATSVITVGEQAFAENHRWRHATNLVADAREAAQTATVTMRFEDPERDLTHERSATDAIYFYALDWAAYTQITDELAQHQAQVTTFDADHMAMDYAADKSGWLMISLPQEKGWSATVNGAAVELSAAYEGALMLVPVAAGSNHVELKFMPPGLVIGCAVTGASLLLAAFVGIFGRTDKAVLH